MQSTGAIELNFIRMLRLLSFPSPQCAVARLDPLAESFARRVWTEAASPPLFRPVPGDLGIKGPLCVNGGECQGEFLGCTAETVKRGGNSASGGARDSLGFGRHVAIRRVTAPPQRGPAACAATSRANPETVAGFPAKQRSESGGCWDGPSARENPGKKVGQALSPANSRSGP